MTASKRFQKGYAAHQKGHSKMSNPFNEGSRPAQDWNLGWDCAKERLSEPESNEPLYGILPDGQICPWDERLRSAGVTAVFPFPFKTN